MAEIKFENVSKSFGKTTVIENMNLLFQMENLQFYLVPPVVAKQLYSA